MKTLKPIYWLALTAAFALAACSKDDSTDTPPPAPEPTLTIEQTEYTLDAEEERTATVAFTAVADWTLSVVYDDAESSADWLSVTPSSGTAGEQTVELSAARNFRASARTVYADLACGEQSVRLTVTQTAASGDTDFTAQFDEAFAKELQKQGIIADADNITPEDMEKIAAITSLDVAGSYDNPGTLTSLRGIEYFEALEELSCLYNQLTSLDLSRNTALTELRCDYNQLTSLDVSQNTALTNLGCSSNQLTTLDVSRNTKLIFLDCYSNELTTLDVSRNTALTDLRCNYNQLTALDVSRNTALTDLGCSSNQLTALDVSPHTELKYLSCSSNPLKTLDVSRNTKLIDLYCISNELTSLDVSQNTALTTLLCYGNQLTELDISRNTALTELWCYGNQLTELDISRNTELTTLWCFNNPGDGISSFPITAWFDNDTKPSNLELDEEQWTYGGKTITIDFRKAE